MPHSARSTLAVAFGLSMLLHLTLLPIVHSPTEPQPEETIIPLAFESARPMPTPRPTPRPTPTPKATRPPTPAPHLAQHTTPHRRPISLPHQSARPHDSTPHAFGRPQTSGALGLGESPAASAALVPALPAEPQPVPQPSPTPAATRPPACAQPNVAPATLDPVVPETPPLAQQQGISGDVTVLVSLDEGSHVTGAHVVASPSALLNDSALRAARASTFRTEVRDCRPIAADYAFIVEFTAQ